MTRRRHRALAALLLVACTACAGNVAPSVQYYPLPAGGPPRPFSQSVRVGKMLYLSWQVGSDSTGALVKGGLEPETRQTMANIVAALTAAGSSLDRVVKCTVMMADIREWAQFNVLYATYFPVHKPARSALGANGLALGARVEVECWATVP